MSLRSREEKSTLSWLILFKYHRQNCLHGHARDSRVLSPSGSLAQPKEDLARTKPLNCCCCCVFLELSSSQTIFLFKIRRGRRRRPLRFISRRLLCFAVVAEEGGLFWEKSRHSQCKNMTTIINSSCQWRNCCYQEKGEEFFSLHWFYNFAMCGRYLPKLLHFLWV